MSTLFLIFSSLHVAIPGCGMLKDQCSQVFLHSRNFTFNLEYIFVYDINTYFRLGCEELFIICIRYKKPATPKSLKRRDLPSSHKSNS